VGNAGESLARGQCRRIAIAAALYQAPSLVVMDRPNSDMDEAGLAGLLETMKRLKERTTTLVMVTENPKLLVNTDKILFLKEGQVMMFGPAKEVLTSLRNKQAVQQG
jgi:ABC-type protease/lipase transport system fused ATPase/permease subunit